MIQALLAFWRQNAEHPYARLLLISGAFLLVFLLARITLLAVYWDLFDQLNLTDTLFAFLYGVRFDASTTMVFIGIPLLFLLLPFHWAHSRWWQGFWLVYMYIVLVAFVLVMIGDGIYFGFVQRHAGPEVHAMFGDTAMMLDILATEHTLLLGITLLAVIAGSRIWMRAFHRPVNKPQGAWRRLAMILILLPLIVIVGRGGLQYKPVEVVDAFSYGSAQEGYLTLNGAFAVQHAFIHTAPQRKTFMPQDEAVRITRSILEDSSEQFLSDKFPLMRRSLGTKQDSRAPNIVVVIMESWDAIHMDSIRKTMNLSPVNVTPHFDALSEQGLLFTNFYAAGRRSMDGMAAILAGIPTLPGVPYIGEGLEQSRLSYLGHTAKANGYNTYFLRSANRGSFHLDAVSANAGFDLYKGAEDMPELHTNVPEENTWGAWDHETFTEAHNEFSQSDKPFLGVLFTSTTHNPFRIPDMNFARYPHEVEKNKFLNTIYYSDWALQDFMQKAKQAGYYDNTIFLITADHISKFGNAGTGPKAQYHIPMLIVGPGIKPGTITTTGSQLDVMPTIMQLAGWHNAYAGLGRSLLEKSDDTALALGVNGNMMNIINQELEITHNLERRVSATKGAAEQDIDKLEKKLLAMYQTTLDLILKNRIYREPETLASTD